MVAIVPDIVNYVQTRPMVPWEKECIFYGFCYTNILCELAHGELRTLGRLSLCLLDGYGTGFVVDYSLEGAH